MGYVAPVTKTLTIANGGTTTEAFPMYHGTILGFQMPATFTGTAITFTGCATKGGTYVPVYDSDGNAVSVAVAASRGYTLSGAEADAVLGHNYIKLVSGSSEGAARSIVVTVR